MKIFTESRLLIIPIIILFSSCSAEAQPQQQEVTQICKPAASSFSQNFNLYNSVLDSELVDEWAETKNNKLELVSSISTGSLSLVILVLLILGLLLSGIYFLLLGFVKIEEEQVGIVIKKGGVDFSKKLPPDRIIALNGEPGIQADLLPPGLHRNYFIWQYTILKEDFIVIPQGEIALVIAQDGAPMEAGKALGKVVDCDDFQDARSFLENGEEKGQQLKFLTTGTYRINTKLFTIITVNNANKYGLKPELLRYCTVASDKVGIVITHDGIPIQSGEIAGSIIEGHNKFQDPQKFINNGGFRGLQQEILPSGNWDLNPWFAEVEKVPLVEIPTGSVGVVISHVGSEYNSDYLVDSGFKGVCKIPLRSGKHPINTKVVSIEIVPTHEITLDWKNDTSKNPSNYDSSLNSLSLRSKDGFAFNIEITQVIKVPEENAPRMISRIGSPLFGIDGHPSDGISGSPTAPKYTSIKNLVTRVLKPMVENHFRNSVQQYGALEFLDERSDRQREAVIAIREGLREYGVEAVGTYLNEIDLPPDLERALTERKIAEQQKETFEAQQEAEIARQKLVRLKELTEIQQQLVEAEEGLKIAELEAESQMLKGGVEVDLLSKKIEAFGAENYAAVKIVETMSQNKMRLVPELSFDSKDNYGSALLQWLVGSFLQPRNTETEELNDISIPSDKAKPDGEGSSNDFSAQENIDSNLDDLQTSDRLNVQHEEFPQSSELKNDN